MPDRIESYLTAAAEQIRWKRARPALVEELRTHLLDQRDACLAEGMSEEAAQAEAVRQMGDPVTVGQGLDRVHRPKPQWELLALTVLVAVTGVVLRLILCSGEAWFAEVVAPGRTLVALALGIAALLGGYFLDYTILGRYGKELYVLALVFGVVMTVWQPFPVGRAYYITHLAVFYPVVYAAWLYAWRGGGWKGFLASSLGLLPLAAAWSYRYLSEVLILLAVGGLLLLVLAWRDWYGIGKRKTIGILAGGLGLLTGVGLIRVLGSDYFRSRILYAIHPELSPTDHGYMGMTIRQILDTAQWVGPGQWTGAHPYEMTVVGGQGDFFLTTLLHKLGWLPFLLLAAAVLLLTVWVLVKCLGQKNTLARLTVLAVAVPLLIRGLWAVTMNLGIVMLTVQFPLVTGNLVMVTDMALLGLALSVFRQETLPLSLGSMGRGIGSRFAITRQPGSLTIRWRTE